jgi:hypothetical protein
MPPRVPIAFSGKLNKLTHLGEGKLAEADERERKAAAGRAASTGQYRYRAVRAHAACI